VSTLTMKSLAWPDVQTKLAPYAAIPLRLIVGYGFLAHGLAKWSKGPEAFAGILQATGVPLPHLMAWVTIVTEIVAGIAFLIGAFVSLLRKSPAFRRRVGKGKSLKTPTQRIINSLSDGLL
jgi:putative oxidoreductase